MSKIKLIRSILSILSSALILGGCVSQPYISMAEHDASFREQQKWAKENGADEETLKKWNQYISDDVIEVKVITTSYK